MVLRLLTGLPAAGLGLTLALPARTARLLSPPAGAALRGTAGLAATGVRAAAGEATGAARTAVRLARAARNALVPVDRTR
ncbi:hypothetical protein, partial [Streptomyces sp. UNOC14_S4]|uniref:hypothetical protein n=1 Tax=Streptomyces sp. UNOC14_S4 TaxID=2872340 RepID=UPI001E354E6B